MPSTSSWTFVSSPTAVTGNTNITPAAARNCHEPQLLSAYFIREQWELDGEPCNGEWGATGDVCSRSRNGRYWHQQWSGPTITIPAHVHLESILTEFPDESREHC